MAVHVACRRSPVMSDISPKNWPGPSTARLRCTPSTLTRTSTRPCEIRNSESPGRALTDDVLARREALLAERVREAGPRLVVEHREEVDTLERRHAARNRVVGDCGRLHDRADWEGDLEPGALRGVPHAGAHLTLNRLEPQEVLDPDTQRVRHRALAELHHEAIGRRVVEHAGRAAHGVEEHGADLVRQVPVVE